MEPPHVAVQGAPLGEPPPAVLARGPLGPPPPQVHLPLMLEQARPLGEGLAAVGAHCLLGHLLPCRDMGKGGGSYLRTAQNRGEGGKFVLGLCFSKHGCFKLALKKLFYLLLLFLFSIDIKNFQSVFKKF